MVTKHSSNELADDYNKKQRFTEFLRHKTLRAEKQLPKFLDTSSETSVFDKNQIKELF